MLCRVQGRHGFGEIAPRGPSGGKERWTAAEVSAVDTRCDPEAAARLRSFWAQVGLERAARDSSAVLSFNLGTLAAADLERVRELHRRYFSELRDIVAASTRGEHVLLANVQLVLLA